MFVAVRMLYREGTKIKPVDPPVVGQIISDSQAGVQVLRLWPLDWRHHETTPRPPTAELWHPTFSGVGFDNLVVRGLEGIRKGPAFRWTTQKWLCEVLTPERARNYFRDDRIRGALPSSMPPSPPPADPDRPFE